MFISSLDLSFQIQVLIVAVYLTFSSGCCSEYLNLNYSSLLIYSFACPIPVKIFAIYLVSQIELGGGLVSVLLAPKHLSSQCFLFRSPYGHLDSGLRLLPWWLQEFPLVIIPMCFSFQSVLCTTTIMIFLRCALDQCYSPASHGVLGKTQRP